MNIHPPQLSTWLNANGHLKVMSPTWTHRFSSWIALPYIPREAKTRDYGYARESVFSNRHESSLIQTRRCFLPVIFRLRYRPVVQFSLQLDGEKNLNHKTSFIMAFLVVNFVHPVYVFVRIILIQAWGVSDYCVHQKKGLRMYCA